MIEPPEALLLDLDGTLYQEDAAIPGAPEAIRMLLERRVPVRYLTNTTRFSRRQLSQRLGQMGMPVREEELFTAPVAAADWLRKNEIERVMLCLPDAVGEQEFSQFDRDTVAPEAVVVGDLGDAWTFSRMNRAFRALMDGAALVALQKNRFWENDGGLSLDAGPFVAALEYASDTPAVVVGKPSTEFFMLAVESLGVRPARIAVVGDDIENDVRGAQKAGLRGALVRTGKFRQEQLDHGTVIPHDIAGSIGDLVRRWYGAS